MNKITRFKLQAVDLFKGISKEIITTNIYFHAYTNVEFKDNSILFPRMKDDFMQSYYIGCFIQGSLLYVERAEPDAYLKACITYVYLSTLKHHQPRSVPVFSALLGLGLKDSQRLSEVLMKKYVNTIEGWYAFYKQCDTNEVKPILKKIQAIEYVRNKSHEYRFGALSNNEEIPSYMRTALTAKNKKYIDWRSILKSALYDYGKRIAAPNKFNRRLISRGIYVHGHTYPKSLEKATLFIDASGSVSVEELQMMIDSIYNLLHEFSTKVDLFFFSNTLSECYSITDVKELNVITVTAIGVYGGGTRIVNVVDYINDNPCSDFICVLTDMEFVPVEPDKLSLGKRRLYWLNTNYKAEPVVKVGSLINIVN